MFIRYTGVNDCQIVREAKQVWLSSDDPGIVFANVGEEHPLRFGDGTLQVISDQGCVIAEHNIDAMQPIGEAA